MQVEGICIEIPDGTNEVTPTDRPSSDLFSVWFESFCAHCAPPRTVGVNITCGIIVHSVRKCVVRVVVQTLSCLDNVNNMF